MRIKTLEDIVSHKVRSLSRHKTIDESANLLRHKDELKPSKTANPSGQTLSPKGGERSGVRDSKMMDTGDFSRDRSFNTKDPRAYATLQTDHPLELPQSPGLRGSVLSPNATLRTVS